MTDFGNQLAAARKAKGLTQDQLAQQMNVSRSAIGHWERGDSSPDIDTIKQLSSVLDYNFFAIDNESAQPADNTSPQEVSSENTPISTHQGISKKKKKILLYSLIGSLIVLALIAGILCVINGRPAPGTYKWYQQQDTKEEEGKSFVTITPRENPLYAEFNEDFERGIAWEAIFDIEEHHGIPFTVENLTVHGMVSPTEFFELDYCSPKKLLVFWDTDTIKKDAPQEYVIGMPRQGFIAFGITVDGTDANGNYQTFSGYVDLCQELKN